MVKKAKTETGIIEISEVESREITFNVLGQSPLIMERFSQKAWRELLFPGPTKNRAERSTSLKHDPFEEFRQATYVCRDPKAPTLIHMPNGAFHGALASAALDIPGAKKAQMERLTRVIDVTVHLFGIPNIFCAMVRNSDINRTPDVRTRPIFPQWACRVTVRYIKSVLNERTIANLFGAAGLIIGVGGWRGEKGGPYGSWKLVPDGDREFTQVLKQARKAQEAAMAQPIFYDDDTTEILTWFQAEVLRRERGDLIAGAEKGKRKPGRPPAVKVFTEDKHGNLTNNG